MNDSYLSLNWRCHHNVLMSAFEHLLENNILLDCTLAAEGQCVKAHRVILAASSPYFQLLFTEETEKHPIIILKDVKFRELKTLLEFMYKGEVEVPEKQLQSILNLANSLEIKGLKSHGNDKTRKTPAFSEEASASENSCLMSNQQSTIECQHISEDNCCGHPKTAFPSENSNSIYCDETICEKRSVSQDDPEGNFRKADPSHQRKLPSSEQNSESEQVLPKDCTNDRPRSEFLSDKWCFPSCQATQSKCDHCFQEHLKVNCMKASRSQKNNFQCCQLSSDENGHVFEVCSNSHPERIIREKTYSSSHKQTTSQGVQISQHHIKTIMPQSNTTVPCLPHVHNESVHKQDSQECLQRPCEKPTPSQKSTLPFHQNSNSEHIYLSQDHHEDNCRKTAPSQKSQSPCCQQNNNDCVNVFQVHFECNCNTAVSSSKNNSTFSLQTSRKRIHVPQDCFESNCARECLPQNNISSCQNTESAQEPSSGDCLEERCKKTVPAGKNKSQSKIQQNNSDCQNVFQVHFECKCKTTGLSSNNSPSSQQIDSKCTNVSQDGMNSNYQRTVSLCNNISVPCQQEQQHVSQDGIEKGCNTGDSQQTHGSLSPVSDDCVFQDHLETRPERPPVVSLTNLKHQKDWKAVPSSDAPVSLISPSANLSRSNMSILEHVQSNVDDFPQSNNLREMCAEPSNKVVNIVECCDEEDKETFDDSANIVECCGEEDKETFDESADIQNVSSASKMYAEPQETIQVITLYSDEENEMNSSVEFQNENCDRKSSEEPPENIEACSDIDMNDSLDMQDINVAFNESSPTKEAGPRISSIHCSTDCDSLIFNCVASDTDCNENTNHLQDRLLSCTEIISLAQASVERTELTEYVDEDQSHIPRKRIRIQEETESIKTDCRNIANIPGTYEVSPTNTQENSSEEHFYESDPITKDNANRNYNLADGKEQLSHVPETQGKVPMIAATISVRQDLHPSDIQNSCQLENINGSFSPTKLDFSRAHDDIKEEPFESENIQKNSTSVSPEVLKCKEIQIKEEPLELENFHSSLASPVLLLNCDGIGNRDKILGLGNACRSSSPSTSKILECDQIDIKEESLHETESELVLHSEPSVSKMNVHFQPNCAQKDETHIEVHCDDISNLKVTESLENFDNNRSESKTVQEVNIERKSNPGDAIQASNFQEELALTEIEGERMNCGLENVSTDVFGTQSDCELALCNSNESNTSITTNKMVLKLSPICPANMELQNHRDEGTEDIVFVPDTIECYNFASEVEHHCDELHSNATCSQNPTEEQDPAGYFVTQNVEKEVATTSQNQGPETVLDCVEFQNLDDAFKPNNAKRQKITHSPERNASVSELHMSASILASVETAGSPNPCRPGSVGEPQSISNVEDDRAMVRRDTICNMTSEDEIRDSVDASEDDIATDKSKFSSAEDDDDNNDEDEDELISKGYWHTCSRCGKNFAFLRCLERHQREHKRERARRCKECGKVFPNLYILNRHKVIHLDHPCKCNECGKIFRRSDHLQQHQQLHMREHSFKCQQCGKAFLRSDHLMRHQQESHPGARSHICNECRMAFTNANALALHKQLHSRQRLHPHKCQDCGKSFKRSEHLLHHQQVHQKKKSFA